MAVRLKYPSVPNETYQDQKSHGKSINDEYHMVWIHFLDKGRHHVGPFGQGCWVTPRALGIWSRSVTASLDLSD